jgi:hypothetical protein
VGRWLDLCRYPRGHGFDSLTIQTFVCMNMSVCMRSGCFLYVTQKNVYRYVLYVYFIRSLVNIVQALLSLELNSAMQ